MFPNSIGGTPVRAESAAAGSARDFLIDVQLGKVPGYSIVHKFGEGSVGTSLTVVSQAAVYKTPTTATALELVSSDAADAQNGVGARELTIIGLDANWREVIQTVTTHATDGTTAVALGTNLIRLYRWYVSSTGTYATATAGSHAGILTIREAGAGATWSTLPITPFPIGQSLIGAYTIPKGKTGYILSSQIDSDSAKSVTSIFFQRPNADDVSTPYSGAMRTIDYDVGVVGAVDNFTRSPRGALVGPCDIGLMAKVAAGTADVSVNFEILLVDS